MKRATIKDIAKLAGVSCATVSRAINGAKGISTDTRRRVLDICRQTDYHANALARSLVSSRSGVIGLILPRISNTFYGEVAFNIEVCAHEYGYSVMMCNNLNDLQQTEQLLNFMTAHRADGIIIVSTHDDIRKLIAPYARDVPIVVLGECFNPNGVSVCNGVSIDNFSAAQLATEYLIGLGHRDIVYLGFRGNSTTHTHRCSGYRQTMERHGLIPYVVRNNAHFSGLGHGKSMAKRLFASGRPCTAILASSDSIALGVMEAAEESGLKIPEELSLAGVDNCIYSGLPGIMLTTVDQRKMQLAREAVKLLAEVISQNGSMDLTYRILRPALVERNTCAPVRAK